MNKPTKTNWELLDTMSDDQIDTSDIPQLTEEFFATAQWRMPKDKDQAKLQAYRIETIVSQDGELHLQQLPFHPGEMVEVIVRSRHMERIGAGARSLRETVSKYAPPTDPVAPDDETVRKSDSI